MKTNVVPLSSDMSVILKRLTAHYPLESLCRDYESNVLLTMGDGQIIFDELTQDELLSVFDESLNHFYLRRRQLLRAGQAAGLSYHEKLALLLKGDWEYFLALTTDFKYPYKDLVRKNDIKASSFAADKKELFSLLEENQKYGSHDLVYNKFCLAIDEMIARKFYEISFLEVDNLFAETIKEDELTREQADQEQLFEFQTQKKIFLQLHIQVPEILYEFMQIKLFNQNVIDRYMQIFGPKYLGYLNVFIEYQLFQAKIRLKEESPSLTEEEIDSRLAEVFRSRQEELLNLEEEIHRVNRLQGKSGKVASAEDIAQYVEEIKSTLRRCLHLLHPDKRENFQFTEQQSDDLKRLYEELAEVKSNFVYEVDSVGHYYPQLSKLQMIEYQAKKIFKQAGIQVEDELFIQGETLLEKISFLKKEIMSLESQKTYLLLEKRKEISNTVVQSYNRILNRTADSEIHNEELDNKFREYSEALKTAKEKYNSLKGNGN